MVAPADTGQISDSLHLLYEPGHVYELRIPHTSKGTASGYYNDFDALARAAAKWSGKVAGVYATLNPVLPQLLARSSNHERYYVKKEDCTFDQDVLLRRRVGLDFDPVRAAGISSSDEEHQAAIRAAQKCRAWLSGLGWPDPLFADSGNGAHLVYGVDLPNDEQSHELIASLLEAVAARCNTEAVKVDTSVANASRIWKLYGTLAAKGDPLPDRPHRVARILQAPDALEPVPFKRLDAVAEMAREAKRAAAAERTANSNKNGHAKGHDDKWARTALEKEVEGLRSAESGDRNNHLFRSAAALAEIVSAGRLSEWEVKNALEDAAHSMGLDRDPNCGPGQIKSTIDSGFAHGMRNPRGPKDEGRKTNTANTNGYHAGSVPPFSPPGVAPSEATDQDPTEELLIEAPLSDAGNAECFEAVYGEIFRYDHNRKKGEGWLEWDGGCWHRDENGAARRAALRVIRRRKAAAATIENESTRKKHLAYAVASENDHKREAMLRTASTLNTFTTTISQYDRDPWIAATRNGTLDLRTGALREPLRADMLTMRLGTRVDPEARPDRWLRFLAEVFDNDQELIAYLQRAIGYSLTGSIREQKMFFLVGDGSNGKSTFLSILNALLGDYAATAAFTTFDNDRRSDSTNDLARLKGRRMVTVVETNEDRKLDEARIKSVTGGDAITCRFLFCEEFEYVPTYKLWMAVNHKPLIRGTDRGIWRRIQLIEFNQIFVDKKPSERLLDGERRQDKNLEAQLISELPGILNWALEGLRLWLEDGLGESAAIIRATEGYRKESDLVGQWFLDHAYVSPGEFTIASEAYTSFAAWCKSFGYPTMSQTSFGRNLATKGYQPERLRHQRGYRGFILSSSLNDD